MSGFDHVSISPRLQSGVVAKRVDDADERLDLREGGRENGAIGVRRVRWGWPIEK